MCLKVHFLALYGQKRNLYSTCDEIAILRIVTQPMHIDESELQKNRLCTNKDKMYQCKSSLLNDPCSSQLLIIFVNFRCLCPYTGRKMDEALLLQSNVRGKPE
jgi:hypothetical protein